VNAQVGFAVGNAIRTSLSKLDVWLEGKEVLGELSLPKDAKDPRLTPAQTQASTLPH
jgi:hypothetical protein